MVAVRLHSQQGIKRIAVSNAAVPIGALPNGRGVDANPMAWLPFSFTARPIPSAAAGLLGWGP